VRPVRRDGERNRNHELDDVGVVTHACYEQPDQEDVQQGLHAIDDVEAQVFAPPASVRTIGYEAMGDERHGDAKDGGNGCDQPVWPCSIQHPVERREHAIAKDEIPRSDN